MAFAILRRGSAAALGLWLLQAAPPLSAHESRLSIGPDSELALATFAYAPAENRLALVVRLTRGALAFVSGRIAKLMPEAVRLETPTSVIGVRGTHALVNVEGP